VKDIIIKVWPEISNYLPALIPLQSIEKRSNSVFIDFTNCFEVNSSGLNLFLIQILKILTDGNTNRGWYTNDTEEVPMVMKIEHLNFFNILNKYSQNTSLFQSNFTSTSLNTEILGQQRLISFPIYIIDFKNFAIRRKALDHLKNWIYENLMPYYDKYDFILPQLASIINEIAKNTADHTQDNAFIGLDVLTTAADKSIKICFSIGDLGVGINQNIKDHLPDEKSEKRYKNWDLTQTYREALDPGFSTKMHSTENKGLGMSLILDGAKGAGVNLSVFDANSRGILSNIKSLAHSEIRKNFFNINKDSGFFYYGELEANILT
jgi:hypothetical protein